MKMVKKPVKEQICALAWVQRTTPEEPKRPKHLRACVKQMRELEYRIREAENSLKQQVKHLHKLVVETDNTVYIGLQEEIQSLGKLLAFLSGIRVSYRVICTEHRKK